MTLVVADKSESTLTMVSDMRIQHRNGAPVSWQDWAIKIAIPHPQLCVAFAGPDGPAEEAMAALRARTINHDDLEGLTKHFLQHHQRSRQWTPNDPTTFLLGLGDLNRPIITIRDGQAHKDEFGWIGSQRAYSRFQAARRGDEEAERSLEQAMQVVIDDRTIDEVDGFPLTVGHGSEHPESTAPRSFHYPVEYRMYGQRVNKESKDGCVTWTPGSASTGSYSIFMMRANRSDGERHAAFYFPQGGFGIYYHPQHNGILRPEVIHDDEDRDFAQRLKEEYDVELFCWPGRRGYQIRGSVENSGDRQWTPVTPRIEKLLLDPLPIPSNPPEGPILRGELICACCGRSKGSPWDYAQRIVEEQIAKDQAELDRLRQRSRNHGSMVAPLNVPAKGRFHLRFYGRDYEFDQMIMHVRLWAHRNTFGLATSSEEG